MDRALLTDRLPTRLQGHVTRLRQHAARRSFAWNVSIMLVGAAAGQSFSVLLAPVLTRLFTPEQFGYLSVYNSLLTILAVVASLGLDVAIPICLDEAECANLVALSGMALSATTCICVLVMGLLPSHVFAAAGMGGLAAQWYLVPLGLAWLGGYYILVALATRAAAFKEIARTRISQGISGPISQILFGVIGLGTPGLVVGFLIGQASGTLLLLSRLVFRDEAWLRQICWRGIGRAARRYAEFPLYASWARLLDMAGGGMILYLLFSACYGPEVAGFMFLSERVIMRPLVIVSTSLLQVFTGEAGRAVSQDPQQLRRRFFQLVPRQFLFAAAWILVANALAEWAFPLLFGPVWAQAIPYLRALSIVYLLFAVLLPVSTVLQMLERQRIAAVWQIGRLVCVVGGVLLPWHAGVSALGALWISAAIQAACCSVLLALIVTAIGQEVARRSEATA